MFMTVNKSRKVTISFFFNCYNKQTNVTMICKETQTRRTTAIIRIQCLTNIRIKIVKKIVNKSLRGKEIVYKMGKIIGNYFSTIRGFH